MNKPKQSPSPSHAQAFSGALSCGDKIALLIVDVVEAYLRRDSPLFLPEMAQPALESNLRIAKAARRANAPVVLTNVEYDSLGQNGGYFFKKVPALSSLVKGSAFGAFPEGLRQEGDLLITKQYPSAFFGTSLAPTLRSLNVDTVFITGYSTSGCVRASAVDAIQHGFIPFVIRDACADRATAQHDANLFDIEAKYGEVISETDAINLIAS